MSHEMCHSLFDCNSNWLFFANSYNFLIFLIKHEITCNHGKTIHITLNVCKHYLVKIKKNYIFMAVDMHKK